MAPEKPKNEQSSEESGVEPPAGSSARKRAESLVSGSSGPEPGQASQRLREKREAEAAGKPVLTEKQRIEARRRRQAKRRRPVTGNVLSRGVRATGFEVKRTAIFLGRSVLSGLDALKPALEFLASGLRTLAHRIGAGFVLLFSLSARLLARLGQVILLADRVITARRALIVVAVVAAGLLVASQFTDFRAIEIGQPGYVQVEGITSAPRTEIKSPVDTHSFLLVAAGLVALAAALLTLRSRRRPLGLVIAVAGGVALAVSLAIDLPAGLDVADAQLSYAGVKAVLLSGFWLELASGAVLLVSGLTLSLEPAPGTARVRRSRPATTGDVAGGRA